MKWRVEKNRAVLLGLKCWVSVFEKACTSPIWNAANEATLCTSCARVDPGERAAPCHFSPSYIQNVFFLPWFILQQINKSSRFLHSAPQSYNWHRTRSQFWVFIRTSVNTAHVDGEHPQQQKTMTHFLKNNRSPKQTILRRFPEKRVNSLYLEIKLHTTIILSSMDVEHNGHHWWMLGLNIYASIQIPIVAATNGMLLLFRVNLQDPSDPSQVLVLIFVLANMQRLWLYSLILAPSHSMCCHWWTPTGWRSNGTMHLLLTWFSPK